MIFYHFYYQGPIVGSGSDEMQDRFIAHEGRLWLLKKVQRSPFQS